MKSIVIYNGHRIVVEHHLNSIKLVVDDIKLDEILGLKNTNKDNVLQGIINDSKLVKDVVKVEYIDGKFKKLFGIFKFYYNDILIAEKKTL